MGRADELLNKMGDGAFRPGEISSAFIQKIGGKDAFITKLTAEWTQSRAGSAVRKSIIDLVRDDMKKANERATGLEDWDEDSLKAFAENVEQKAADARVYEEQRAAAEPAGAQAAPQEPVEGSGEAPAAVAPEALKAA